MNERATESKTNHSVTTLRNDHDLSLPTWGPYGKRLAGVAEVREPRDGSLFECALIPAFHKGRVFPPEVLCDTGWYTTDADSRLQQWTTRHDLAGKVVFFDISWTQITRGVSAEVTCRNNSKLPVEVDLISCCWLNPGVATPARLRKPADSYWIDALDYTNARSAGSPHRLRQNRFAAPPGAYYRNPGFTKGQALGPDFPGAKGDSVDYKINLTQPIPKAVLRVRYHRWCSGSTVFSLLIHDDRKFDLDLPFREEPFSTVDLALGDLPAGPFAFRLQGNNGRPILMDGYFLGSESLLSDAQWIHKYTTLAPLREKIADDRQRLSYEDGSAYEIFWKTDAPVCQRTILGNGLEQTLTQKFLDLVHQTHQTEGTGHFELLQWGPILVPPGSSKSLAMEISRSDRSDTSLVSLKGKKLPKGVGDNRKLRRGVELLAATLATNVTYPHRFRHSYVKAEVPGAFWDCFYSWDNGFSAMGMSTIDPDRAWESLAVYLMDPDDPYAAWLESGTPLPVQIYLLHALWQRTGNKTRLKETFPKALQFYRWLVGRSYDSTTARLESSLLQTWDYNYNSGGWDDYPAQQYLADKEEMRAKVAPMVTTTHAIRTAKLLTQLANVLGEGDVIAELQDDIHHLAEAVQSHAWDAEEGWFGYVVHSDPYGKAEGLLRHESGVNFNRGLDGLSPFIAGICTPDQCQQIVSHLFDPNVLWTDFGPTTVDQSSPYYKPNGYWNGSIWIPHLWFFWKSLLDHGFGKEALLLVETLLALWTRETDASKRCYEHFGASSGRGRGWHHFAALSSPILLFYEALHCRGTLTLGFDCQVGSVHQRSRSRFRADIQTTSANSLAWWSTSPGKKIAVLVDGQPLEVRAIRPTLWEWTLPLCRQPVELIIHEQ